MEVGQAVGERFDKKIQEVNSEIMTEELRQIEFNKVLNKIEEVWTDKPELLKQFYEQAKLTDMNLSEIEFTSKRDYDLEKLNIRFWSKLERDSKKAKKKNGGKR